MTRVATLAQSRFAMFSTLQTQQRLFNAQREVATGLKSQDFAGIQRDASRLVSVKNEVARVEQFKENIAIADRRLQMMTFSIGRVEEVARGFRTTLLNAKNGDTAEATGVPALAQGLLDQIVDLLNVRDDSRFLFAGGAIQTRPVQLDNGTYTPPTVPPFPAAANFDYYEGDAVLQQARVDEDFVVDYGLTASAPAFEKVIRAFDAISELSFSTPISDAERQVIDEAVTLLNAALDVDPGGERTVKDLFAEAELDRKLINDVKSKHDNFILFAETTIADIEQVDTAEAVATLNFEQVVLEASFASLARIQQISLSGFLR